MLPQGPAQHSRYLVPLDGRPVGLDIVNRRREPAPCTTEHIGDCLLERREEAARLVVFCGNHVYTRHRIRPLQLLRGLELSPIDLQRRQEGVRRKVDANAKGSPSLAASPRDG